jgi:hypothetical protein
MMMELAGRGHVACLALVCLMGCEPPEEGHSGDTDAPAVVEVRSTADPPPLASTQPSSWVTERDGLRVTKAGFESRNLTWPLTVDTALIGCKPPELLWMEAAGERYGLNGMGQIHLKLDRFDDVWMFDEEFAAASGVDEVRVAPTDLMNEARKLCA